VVDVLGHVYDLELIGQGRNGFVKRIGLVLDQFFTETIIEVVNLLKVTLPRGIVTDLRNLVVVPHARGTTPCAYTTVCGDSRAREYVQFAHQLSSAPTTTWLAPARAVRIASHVSCGMVSMVA